MQPNSWNRAGELPHPNATAGPAADAPATPEGAVHPTGGYTGPERRATGILIAEVIPEVDISEPARESGA